MSTHLTDPTPYPHALSGSVSYGGPQPYGAKPATGARAPEDATVPTKAGA
ncbi:hypothetical protein ACIO93_12695 [Streptomyces sp. NPDC087903]